MNNSACQECFEYLERFIWISSPVKNQPLAPKTSVKVGGPAYIYIEIHKKEELRLCLAAAKLYQVPYFILGKGTNLLIQDMGFPGIMIQLMGDFSKTIQNENQLQAGAAVKDAWLSRYAAKNGLSGLEFLMTIPGTIGGATYMNAGAFGSEMKDLVEWVQVMNQVGEIQTIKKEDLDFSYRSSCFSKKAYIILQTCFSLQAGNKDEIDEKISVYIQKRKETQPFGIKTWGSVFRNPPNESAGKLIDSLGLKGKQFGGARISPKHANFIENKDNASFEDLMKCVDFARTMVFNKHGIELEMEGEIVPPIK